MADEQQNQQPAVGFEHIYDLYYLNPQAQNHEEWNLAGRYMIHDGEFSVLADYLGFLGHIKPGPINERTEGYLRTLNESPYFRVVNREDHRQGLHPDLLEENPGNGGRPVVQPRPPSVFTYEHPVINQPITLEYHGGQMYFNGHALSLQEAHRILQNIRSGVATIRYKRDMAPAAVQKMEKQLQSLAKIEPKLAAALGQLREASKSGALHPDVVKTLMREIFVDPMVPSIGNKKAYEDFLSRPKEGVHVRLDGNDFGQINKIHSFDHGNSAIKAMGQAMRAAADEEVGRGQAKLFRIGGDEFHLHVPTVEHAAAFMRNLRNRLDAVPPIGGTHNLSVSAGFGRTPEEADQASIQAKQAKKAKNYSMGQAKTHVHSLVPGSEGPVPVEKEAVFKAPPTEARPQVPGAGSVAPEVKPS